MKKRILCFSIAIFMVLSAGSAAGYAEEYAGYSPQAQQQYTDVPTTHWAFQSIDTCSQRDWFGGYPDGTFQPTSKIRRDEAAKVFTVALGLPVGKNSAPSYSDTGNSWAKEYIEAAKGLFPNTTTLAGTESFRPEQTITREETIYALVVAWRYASKTEHADQSVLHMFSDKNSISASVKPYVAVAVQEGLISGIPDGKGGSAIQGQTGLSRAEFATLLARALGHGYGEDEPYCLEESTPAEPLQPSTEPTPNVPAPSDIPVIPAPSATPSTAPDFTPAPEATAGNESAQEPPADNQPDPEPSSPSSALTPTEAAQYILESVNRYRSEAGAEPLALDDKLCQAANLRAKELETLFSHTRPDGRSCFSVFSEVGLNFLGTMGENIAMGYVSPEHVMNGWMDSQGHRENILNEKFSNLGVGLYEDGNGRLHWVQLFTG